MHGRSPLPWGGYPYRSMNRPHRDLRWFTPLESRYSVAGASAKHREQGFHQGHGAGDANAVNHRHFPTLVTLGIKKASHHHDASGNESENHDQVQAVPQRTSKLSSVPVPSANATSSAKQTKDKMTRRRANFCETAPV